MTPSTVSAVLRGNRKNVRYSEATRERVLAAAARLDYRPNRLAQSLVSGTPPIAALALHTLRMMPFSYYSYDNLRQAALSFHDYDYEMAFVPFEDADEQLARLRRLVDGRLVGGIITNVVAEDCGRLVAYLRRSGVPAILLGYLPDIELPSLYIDREPMLDALAQRGRDRGFARVYIVEERTVGNDVLQTQFRQGAEQEEPPAIDFAAADTLFITSGQRPARQLHEDRGVPLQRIWMVEDKRLQCDYRPLIHVDSLQSRRMELAVRLLADWMAGRAVPAKAPIPVTPREEDIQWID